MKDIVRKRLIKKKKAEANKQIMDELEKTKVAEADAAKVKEDALVVSKRKQFVKFLVLCGDSILKWKHILVNKAICDWIENFGESLCDPDAPEIDPDDPEISATFGFLDGVIDGPLSKNPAPVKTQKSYEQLESSLEKMKLKLQDSNAELSALQKEIYMARITVKEKNEVLLDVYDSLEKLTFLIDMKNPKIKATVVSINKKLDASFPEPGD